MLLPVGQDSLRLGGADTGQPVQVIGVGGIQIDDLVGQQAVRALPLGGCLLKGGVRGGGLLRGGYRNGVGLGGILSGQEPAAGFTEY